MEHVSSLAIVIFAALIHASFQLSVSTLTLMSGHAIGKRTAKVKLLRLTASFIAGIAIMATLLVSATAYIASQLLHEVTSPLVWSVVSGALFTLGVSVWLFYFPKNRGGTSLWLPRTMAEFLSKRSKKTHSSGEAFGLGLTSVIAEVLFLMGPIVAASLALLALPPAWQLGGLALYVVVSMAAPLTIGILISAGYGLGKIQKWRETNKKFLQFVAGGGLIILALYIYVERAVTAAVLATKGML